VFVRSGGGWSLGVVTSVPGPVKARKGVAFPPKNRFEKNQEKGSGRRARQRARLAL
jgi:hypothetical protein